MTIYVGFTVTIYVGFTVTIYVGFTVTIYVGFTVTIYVGFTVTIYVGFTVIELSKLHMYVFHYNQMKVKYPHANQLRLFTDTDSLAYAVQNDNIYKDMATDAADRYDFSEYPLDHPLYDTYNHKALGFFKDELNSVSTQEFVGLRPKCYAFLCTGKVVNVLEHTRPVEKKTAKVVKRKVKDVHLHFTHYLDTLRSFKCL